MLQIPEAKLKEILIKDGVVSAKEFDQAMADAKRMGQAISDILSSRNLITGDYYNAVLAKFYGVAMASLSGRTIDGELARLLPEQLAREKRAIVFGKTKDGTFQVAMEDPTNLETIEFLSKFLKSRIEPFLATREDLNKGFSLYGQQSAEEFKRIIEENIKKSLSSKISGIKQAAQELPIVAIVDNMLSFALSARASDIHIEALEGEVLVRNRIDGVLKEIIRIQKEVHPAVVARVKLLGGLKLDEHSKPQDGRFRYKVGKDMVDIRVAIMPTFYGEKIVMRLLSATERPLSLQELGFFPDHIELILKNIKKTFGMVLMTGPTGSGKTTTLYSLLNILNRPEVNIVTVEDPIEYDMKYVNQTQVNESAGITFATGLREIVRQDPNIIMVGEIRDNETARIAVQAALTGHLVLSSLHTNDATTAVPRLIDLGLPPFLVAATLNLVQAQRLVRRICVECIESYKPSSEELAAINSQLSDLGLTDFKVPLLLYRGAGCAACGGTGYKGRMGIFEILDVKEAIRKAIINPEFSLDVLRSLAKKQGMISMFEDGLRKVEQGQTTISELMRVIKE